MLLSLLQDRFKLKVHTEAKEQNGYALVVGPNGPKFKAAEPVAALASPPSENGFSADFSRVGSIRFIFPETDQASKLEMASVNMDTFADLLSPLVNRPVMDMTGLKGAYHISLETDPETAAAILMSTAGIGMNQAGLPVDAQDVSGNIKEGLNRLGLRLEARRVPVEAIVIDHVEKAPTEN